jgi:flagellar biosynthetic protein FliR
MSLEIQQLTLGFLLLCRVTGVLLFLPVFAGRSVPKPVRVALSVLVAVLVYPVVTDGAVVLPTHTVSLIILMMQELLLGLFLGMAVRMVFFAIELAGHVISMEVGLMMTQAVDPLTQHQSTVLGRMLYYFGVLIFLALGIHYAVLHAFVQTFDVVPLGVGLTAEASIEALIRDTAHVFSLGLRMAAPLIAVNFTVTMIFAVLGKAVPKMNVLLVSFAVRIWAGVIVLVLSIGVLTHYITQQAEAGPVQMLRYLRF